MLNVIQELEVKNTPSSIYELVLKGGPSKDSVDGSGKDDVEKEEVGHFVIDQNNNKWNILTMCPLDPLFLSLPGMSVCSNNFSH